MVLAEVTRGSGATGKAAEAVIAKLAQKFGNRLVTSQAVRAQHGNTVDLDRQPAAGRGGVPAGDGRRAGGGAAVRGRARAGDRVRHRHLARRPGQRAARRHLPRFPRHEPRARGARRGPRLRRSSPASRASSSTSNSAIRACSFRSIRAPTPRSAAWRRPALRHQRGALRHHEGQRAGAQSRARQRRGDDDGAARQEILGGLRSDAA